MRQAWELHLRQSVGAGGPGNFMGTGGTRGTGPDRDHICETETTSAGPDRVASGPPHSPMHSPVQESAMPRAVGLDPVHSELSDRAKARLLGRLLRLVPVLDGHHSLEVSSPLVSSNPQPPPGRLLPLLLPVSSWDSHCSREPHSHTHHEEPPLPLLPVNRHHPFDPPSPPHLT